jgi:hypothetical protein
MRWPLLTRFRQCWQVITANGAAALPAPAPQGAAQQLPCDPPASAQPSATVGSYRGLTPESAPVVTQQLVPLAWQAYANSNAAPCAAGAARLTSATVTRACQQARARRPTVCCLTGHNAEMSAMCCCRALPLVPKLTALLRACSVQAKLFASRLSREQQGCPYSPVSLPAPTFHSAHPL